MFSPFPQPVPYKSRQTRKRLAVFDCETDPFAWQVIPRPFTCCFWDGETRVDFWGDDCIDQFFAWLAEQDCEYLIYAHNGGNFDYHFCLDYLDSGQSPMLKGSRLSQLMMLGQEFRDSFDIYPLALSKYKKDDFDYNKMRRENRERYRAEILEYQFSDVRYLLELVKEFHAMFGDKMTMASVALPQLQSFHGFDKMDEKTDEIMRPYFFGGRNQCFEVGVLRPSNVPKFRIYDRNSMYPTVMRDALHPVSANVIWQTSITKETAFARIKAKNYGALCWRKPNGGLDFTREEGEFYASIHEIEAGLDTGTLEILEVIEAIKFEHVTKFDSFVEHFYDLRKQADANGDQARKEFYKLVLNSSYGKFAMDPRKFEDWYFQGEDEAGPKGITYADEPEFDEFGNQISGPTGWHRDTIRGGSVFWSRPNDKRLRRFINCATAASITGAARADLLRAIKGATRPIYCDTDSVICEALEGVHFSQTELGGWKCEGEGDVAYIGGKKLYAVMNEGEAVKKASKGVKLTVEQIASVARGEVVEYQHPIPKFNMAANVMRSENDGEHKWTERTIRRTGLLGV